MWVILPQVYDTNMTACSDYDDIWEGGGWQSFVFAIRLMYLLDSKVVSYAMCTIVSDLLLSIGMTFPFNLLMMEYSLSKCRGLRIRISISKSVPLFYTCISTARLGAKLLAEPMLIYGEFDL